MAFGAAFAKTVLSAVSPAIIEGFGISKSMFGALAGLPAIRFVVERGREGARERGREGGREGRREGGKEGGREGGRGGRGLVRVSWFVIFPFLSSSLSPSSPSLPASTLSHHII